MESRSMPASPSILDALPTNSRSWFGKKGFRLIVAVAVAVTVLAMAAMVVMGVRHELHQREIGREADATNAAREWVRLLVSTTDTNFLARSEELSRRTTDPLKGDFQQRMGLYFEILGQHDADAPLRVTSAAVESAVGDKNERPPSMPDAVTVLVTTTLREPRPGGGYSIWLDVIQRDDQQEIANLGIAGSL
jgi:hypothetical protein